MAVDASQIVVGANGSVAVAPTGTAAPATATAALSAGFVELGYTNENGVTFRDAKTTQAIPAWQSFYPVRRIVTARDASVAFGLLQWNADTVPLAFGGGTVTEPDPTGAPGQYRYEPPAEGTRDERMLVVSWTDDNKDYRLIIPAGEVSDAVETNVVRTDNSDLPINFAVNGTDGSSAWYLLTDDPAFA